MSEAPSERRWHTRFELSVPVTVQGEQQEEQQKILGVGQTVDVSQGGLLMLLPSQIPLAAQDIIFVELTVPASATLDGQPHPIAAQARVLRHRPAADVSPSPSNPKSEIQNPKSNDPAATAGAGTMTKQLVAVQFMMPIEVGMLEQ